jgi:hypothetical protein
MQEAQRIRRPARTLTRFADAVPDFVLCYGDLPYRLQRALGLIPAHGLAVGRRAIFAAIVTWVPIAVAAASAGRFMAGATAEPLMQQFGLNVKFLVAVPVLIVGEMVLDRLTQNKIAHFVQSGLVAEPDRPHFVSIVAAAVAWRDGWKPWLVMGVLIAAWTLTPGAMNAHDVLWAEDEPLWRLSLRLGAWWYLFVARPIFLTLVLIWLWRLTVLGVLLVRISRLRLALVPSHPDRAGGLGFLGELPHAFAPLTFALSTVLAAHWGHAAVYHGVELETFVVPLAAFAIATTLVVLASLLAFSGPLMKSRRQAKLDYGALASEHGHLLHRRWIAGEALHDDSLLTATELGPAADAAAIYHGVERTRFVPFDWKTLVWVVIPIAAPMAPLIAIEMHLLDALKVVLSTLK